jgi:cyclopropane-fatty-acyl-phospholipid synthase
MLQKLLERRIRVGHLTVILPNGRRVEIGRPPPGPRADVAVRIRRRRTVLALALHPEFYFGEAYMNGDLVLERGTLWDLMELIGRNRALARHTAGHSRPGLLDKARQALEQANSPRRARRNVAHHYDLSTTLFRSFLDEDLQYSCAYFREPGLSLDEAQRAKIRHIEAKLRLEPGLSVLDIGCGWGGLAIALAQAQDVQVTGVTLSREQLQVCRERAQRAGLTDRVRFELRDYRELTGPFDRIVSVGMFEHVGLAQHAEFFQTVERLLADDGAALIHSIGHRTDPGANNPWIEKYIFPGGHIPALSEVIGAVERTSLWVTDIEILRLHYAQTLRLWRERFLRNAGQLPEAYDDRFVRMWEFYLAGSEMGFRYGDLMVLQAQLAKRVEALPLTRDYMVDTERAWAAHDQPARRERRATRG